MTKEFDDLETMTGALIADRSELQSPEGIRATIKGVRMLPRFQGVTDQDVERMARRFEATHGVTMDLGRVLKREQFEPWLEAERSKIDWYYWNRYKKLLVNKEFSGRVIAALDIVTDRTLGLFENPSNEGSWDRRGLVMGHVQSGKTANYIGLICKAADVGYKVIVVIAGIHNNLRNQTQSRIDEGFVGFDSSQMSAPRLPIGAGKFDSRRRPSTFTNSLRDFSKATASGAGTPLKNFQEPVVFVIKKNSNTLTSLIDWLTEYNHQHGFESITEPMLLIDDEADNASINIKKYTDEISRINGLIRRLLDLFDRSCYVGYTATPFANIFIDPETEDEMFGQDLFPRDFIVALDPPDNYFGPTAVFSDSPKLFVRHIDDNEEYIPLKHMTDFVLVGLPETLQDAIRTFIVARAIRITRGQIDVHNSMLVNVSRFVKVQRQIRDAIHEFLDGIKDSINMNANDSTDRALRDPDIAALYRAYLAEYSAQSATSWRDIQKNLWESISAVTVIEVNMRSSQALDYAAYHKKGLNVIAVGGYSLSRGLTLQGLVVSYFLRRSIMYDTLMQMGRWFGYRPGYEDLCRIWMLEEAEGWYTHIAESIDELGEEFRTMESIGSTPMQFGLKVRSHPDALVVTARNKMGSGKRIVASIGLANQFIETAVLRRDRETLERNRRAVQILARDLRSVGRAPQNGAVINDGAGRLVRRAPCSTVLAFLKAFRNHDHAVLTDPSPVSKYIEDRAMDELSEWDILFMGVRSRERRPLVDSSLGFDLVCQERTEGERSDQNTLWITNKNRVASRGAEEVGLEEEQIQKAKEEYRKEKGINPSAKGQVNYPDRIFRRVRLTPLLIIHLLAIRKRDGELSEPSPVVAWSISFPRTERKEETVRWIVNPTWLREQYGSEDESEEEDDGD